MRVIFRSANADPQTARHLQTLVDQAVTNLGQSPHLVTRSITAPRLPVTFDKGLWTIQQQDGGFALEEPVAKLVRRTLQIAAHPIPDVPDRTPPTPLEETLLLLDELLSITEPLKSDLDSEARARWNTISARTADIQVAVDTGVHPDDVEV